MSKYLIYGLIDPRTLLVRYVGKSSTGLLRPNSHRAAARCAAPRGHCGRWINSLHRLGLDYVVVVLEDIVPQLDSLAAAAVKSRLNDMERWWIAYGRASGWELTNMTSGGDGGDLSHHVTSEARQRGNAKASAWWTPERRARVSGDASPMRDPTVAAKVLATRKVNGRPWHTDEARARIGAGNKGKTLGRPKSAEHRAKMSANNAMKRPEVARKTADARRGMTFGADTRARMSASKHRHWDSKGRKPCGTSAAYSRATYLRRRGRPNCGPCDLCRQAQHDYYLTRRFAKP